MKSKRLLNLLYKFGNFKPEKNNTYFIMAKTNMTKYSNIRVNYKVSVTSEEGDVLIGDSDWQLLKYIQSKGSLKQAADLVGVSYRKAWGDLRRVEKDIGFPIITTFRGGELGGNTQLTDDGENLISSYDKLQINFQNAVSDYIIDFKKSLKEKK